MKGLDCQFAVVMSVWGVKTGKAQREHMFSALLLTTDIAKTTSACPFLPIADNDELPP